ncbi:hypothetical protein Chor_005004 [Crotalus horridus]
MITSDDGIWLMQEGRMPSKVPRLLEDSAKGKGQRPKPLGGRPPKPADPNPTDGVEARDGTAQDGPQRAIVMEWWSLGPEFPPKTWEIKLFHGKIRKASIPPKNAIKFRPSSVANKFQQRFVVPERRLPESGWHFKPHLEPRVHSTVISTTMAFCGPSCAIPSSASIPSVGFGSAGLGALPPRGLGLSPFPSAESSGSLGTLAGVNPSCINQIPPSELTIQPPAVVVTIPGPILSASCAPVAVGGNTPCAPGGLGQIGAGYFGGRLGRFGRRGSICALPCNLPSGIIPSCINQIPPSEVTIQPSAVVVTIPGPILSASCEPVAVGGNTPCAPSRQGLPLSVGGQPHLGAGYGFVGDRGSICYTPC